VVEFDIRPWRFPPRTDFQFGEWLRERFESGNNEPEDPLNPDLAVLLAMVRRTGQPLVGPPPMQVIDEIPPDDLRSALTGVVPGLMSDLPADTANVLLTLARVWQTLETSDFVPKDVAANWAIDRLPEGARSLLEKARDVYLGESKDEWSGLQGEAYATAGLMVDQIRR